MERPAGERIKDLRKAIASAEIRLDWLKGEVALLEGKIQFFDDLSFKIKGWAIAAWSALSSYALTQSDWTVAVLAGVIPMLFMVLDASYKRTQMCFVARTRAIMKLLNDPAALAVGGDYAYVIHIYDLLGIYSIREGDDPSEEGWGPVLFLLRKSSVSLLYWILLILSTLIVLKLRLG